MAKVWAERLQGHPDRAFSAYIVAGLTKGFRIGFDYNQARLSPPRGNMRSAIDNPQVVEEYLSLERAASRVAPLPQPSTRQPHVSAFGVIPKKSKPGKWRLIVDLSAPEGHSVNDGIAKEWCSLSYVSIDKVIAALIALQPGALMAKIDIKHAYRNIPVHPQDRHLLAMQWKGEVLIDKVMPFGLRSAPMIFSAVADALQWCIEQRGVTAIFHYLDDYITIGPPDSGQCSSNLSTIIRTCAELGVPLEEKKCEGPTQCLTFLGMELDSSARTIRLPKEKLERLLSLLEECGNRKALRKRELQSLIVICNMPQRPLGRAERSHGG